MTELNNIELNNIELNDLYPLLHSNLTKNISEEITRILKEISENYNIEYDILINKYYPNNNFNFLFGNKKRIRRVLPTEMMCMGRKLDGKQCTRSRIDNLEYCLSHHKKLPNGRVDDLSYKPKLPGKRGRRKKIADYNVIQTRLETINDEQYLVDDDNNIYTYNIESPEWIGKKNTLGTIDHFYKN